MANRTEPSGQTEAPNPGPETRPLFDPSPSAAAGPSASARAVRWFAVALIPSTLVIAGLATLRRIGLADAAIAWLGIAGLTAVVALAPMLDLARLLKFLHELSLGGTPSPPEMRSQGATSAAAFALSQIRREMRRALAAAELALRSHEDVFDALPDAVVMLGTDHRVLRANLAARTLFGRNLTGRDVSSLVRHPPILAAIDAVEDGEQVLEFSLPIPVERRFIVSIRALPGEIAGDAAILISFHDITTIRRMEQMRADFVANASHELRTPLSSLIGFIDTLRGPARDDAEARERFLGIMAEQAARMARLIEDLLSLSRIELNEHTPPSRSVDLRKLVASTVEGLEPKARARNVTVTVAAPAALPLARGEPDELAQVFQNLIDNALKYTLPDTEVTISLAPLDHGPVSMPREAEGPVIAIAVRDRGEGIAQEHIPRLTERFYRVDSARSRKMGGTGLGLAIVKHVMNRHRGVLTIDSSVGLGSVFTVYLPVAAAEAEPAEAPQKLSRPA